jgi:thiol:disulfide interchange protein
VPAGLGRMAGMERGRMLRGLAAVAALAVSAVSARAQEDYPAKIVAVEVTPRLALPGTAVTVKIDVEVAQGFHVYGLESPSGQRTHLDPPAKGWPDGVRPGDPVETPPREQRSGEEVSKVHDGRWSISLPLKVAADASPGARELSFGLSLMACDALTCRPPKTLPVSMKFSVMDPPTARIVRAAFVGPQVPAGQDATLEIEFTIDEGWHLYAQKQVKDTPPSFRWKLPEGWTQSGGLVEVTEPHDAKLWGEETPYSIHEGKLVLRQAFRVAASTQPGRYEVSGEGKWQRCNNGGCTTDNNVPVAASVEVTASSGAAPPPPEEPAKAESDPEKRESLGSLMLSAAFFGLITILTPCVFPLLPVTVSFFAKQEGRTLPRSIVYAAGIVFTITVIGLIFKSGLDALARGWIFNALVGALFMALSLSLFGLFELRLPTFLVDRSQMHGARGGLIGAFFMAVTLALTSFSCSMPFLAALFTRFDKGEQLTSVLGLIVYSGTIALPFFVCSLFPTLLHALPRSGGWLNSVKVTMGFVELGLAFKFLRVVDQNFGWDMLSRSLVLAIWTACAIGATLYLFGYITLPHDTKLEHLGVLRLLFALTFLAMAGYFVPGVFGLPLTPQLEGFLNTQPNEIRTGLLGGAAKESRPEIPWGLNDWDGALARAEQTHRPVLFDFTGIG